MADSERCGTSGCGWLLLLTGGFAAGVALLVWLVRLETNDDRGSRAGVWVTDSGTRYHHRDCAALARSTPHEISLDEAREQGLAPCDLCGPPA
ncbi:MAG: hypothetical protein R6V07_05705 [Armatimonadota bacterium]